MPNLLTSDPFGGRHAGISIPRNILTLHGVAAPHTGQPYSEAMLLGLALGAHFLLCGAR